MLAPSNVSVVTILLASLIGSIHCSVMCLPFTLEHSKKENHLFHIGRLNSYLLLGSAVFAFGTRFDETGHLRFIFGIFFLILFIYEILKKQTHSGCHLKKQNTTKSFFKGMLAALMPCAWLWSILFLITQTQSYLLSISYITIFWLGTLPVFSVILFKSNITKYLLFLKYKPIRISLVVLLSLTSILIHFQSFQNHVGKEQPLLCLPNNK